MMNYYKQPITNSVCEKNANQSRDWQCGIPLPSAFSSFCLSSVIKVKFGWIRSLIPWITFQSDLREGKQPVSVSLCVCLCVCVYESMLLFFLFYFVISGVFFLIYVCLPPGLCLREDVRPRDSNPTSNWRSQPWNNRQCWSARTEVSV